MNSIIRGTTSENIKSSKIYIRITKEQTTFSDNRMNVAVIITHVITIYMPISTYDEIWLPCFD